MNIKGDLCAESSSPSSHNFISNTAGRVYILLIGKITSFQLKIFGAVGPFGEKVDSFSPLEFDIQDIPIAELQKSSLTQSEI